MIVATGASAGSSACRPSRCCRDAASRTAPRATGVLPREGGRGRRRRRFRDGGGDVPDSASRARCIVPPARRVPGVADHGRPRPRDEKVEFVLNSVIEEVLGDGAGSPRPAAQHRDRETSELEADGIFVAIGHDPTTALFLDWLDHDEQGYLVTSRARRGRTSRGLRRGGRAGPHVPPGGHCRRLGDDGRARRAAVPRRAEAPAEATLRRRAIRRAVAGRHDHRLASRLRAGSLATLAADGRTLGRPRRPDARGAPTLSCPRRPGGREALAAHSRSATRVR